MRLLWYDYFSVTIHALCWLGSLSIYLIRAKTHVKQLAARIFLSEGVQFDFFVYFFFYFFLVEEREDSNSTINGPSSARQGNAI